MPSKQQDVAKSNISPVLFMTVDGEPMSFFLRPGPVKRQLQPLITAGSGTLCNVQQPGAILLIDPEERGSILETSAHWYVSTQYIHDCVEKGEQLNLEDYRLNPEVVPRQSAKLNNSKETSTRVLEGRVAYTAEEDAAILSHVSKHKTTIGGNRLWQEMEKQRVTSHSWQSMKYRYRAQLAKKKSEVVEVTTTEKDTKAAEGEIKVEGNKETDVQKTSSAEDAAPPQIHSADTDLTQIDALSKPSENTQPEIVEAQTSIPPQEEEQHVNSQTDKQPAESSQVETVEAEASNSPQPEGPCLDTQTDARPIPADSAEPEMDESQTIISPQTESVPEDSPPDQPESLPDSSPQKKPKEKQKASLEPEQPQRRSTRRQLVVEMMSSPEPYAKKLRSSTPSPVLSSSSLQPSKKTKSAVKSPLQTDTTVDQPPSKRARGKSLAAVEESQQEETEKAVVSETAQADTESNSEPQEGKKKEKRKLGILELATKEFEDESESDEDGAPDLQNPTETVTTRPTSTKPPIPTSGTAADTHTSTQSKPEHEPRLQEDKQEPQTSSSNCLPKTGGPEPATTEPATTEPATTEPVTTEPATTEPATTKPVTNEPATTEPATTKPVTNEPATTEPATTKPVTNEPATTEPAATEPATTKPAATEPATTEAVNATSKAHLFIFDRESQEEDSQSIIGDHRVASSKPQPTVNKDAAFSLTQVQLEEDKQRIKELMKQTNQDLVSVTKALLRTSGDFSAAREQLLNPSSISGPFWSRCDNALLISADPAVRQQLLEKYSEEGVAKRIMFLEVEG